MRPTKPCLTALFCLLLSAQSAGAASAFFVQLGSASSEEEAEAKWREMKESYPSMLGSLDYTTRTVTSLSGGASEYRMQAGPARNRDQAQRICGNLAGKGMDCFIVETAVLDGEVSFARNTPTASGALTMSAPSAPVAEVASVETKPATPEEPAPVTLAKAPAPEELAQLAPAAGKPAEPVELPWLREAREKKPQLAESAPAPAPEPAPEPVVAAASADESTLPKGRVDVAEAIPVPLSDDQASGEDMRLVMAENNNQPLAIAQPAVYVAPTAGASLEEDELTVQVSGFPNEQEAFRFSESLREKLSGGQQLRMRINRPMSSRGGMSTALLRVSPLPDLTAVADVCAAANAYNSSLYCGSDSHEAPQFASRPLPAPSGKQYVSLSDYAPAAGGPAKAQKISYGSPVSSSYYVLLGSWRSKAEAMRRWESLKQKHATLLGSYEPDIRAPKTASMGANSVQRLRVGPFEARDEASLLCGQLTQRGVSCVPVPE